MVFIKLVENKDFFANREMSEVENVQENWSQFIDLFWCELNTL